MNGIEIIGSKGSGFVKRIKWSAAIYICLIVLAGVIMYQKCANTSQSSMTVIYDVEFEGEYSQDGSEWKVYDKTMSFSSYDGELILRGHMNKPPGMVIWFYLKHIGIKVYVDEEMVFASGRYEETVPSVVCDSYWSGWYIKEIDEDAEIEIRLNNLHKYGNADAYDVLLDSMHMGSYDALETHLKMQTIPYQISGIFMIVMAIILLGVAIGYYMQNIPKSENVCSMGLLLLYMGGYVLLDTIDITFRSYWYIFNTGMRMICIMLATLELTRYMKVMLNYHKKLLKIVSLVHAAIIGVLLLLVFLDVINFCNLSEYWGILQAVISILLLVVCIGELRHKASSKNRNNSIICSILQIFILVELANAKMNWWTSGIVIKSIFVLIVVLGIVIVMKEVICNHKDSERVQRLSTELRNSRIVLAMSQIRTHFIFNVLTAISGMCEYNPKEADESLIRFSRYLRNHIDIMQKDEVESFDKSLAHLEDYVALEQMRFGNKIRFEKEIHYSNFNIPPLVLQPIVENAIKHGLFSKEEGGLIVLRTNRLNENIVITVEDNGVGFNVERIENEESIGLSNIQFRLKHMVNGKLKIESNVGVGTRVTIIIPDK